MKSESLQILAYKLYELYKLFYVILSVVSLPQAEKRSRNLPTGRQGSGLRFLDSAPLHSE